MLDSIGGSDNKLVVIPRAGHCKLIDEPLACCEEVLKFIRWTHVNSNNILIHSTRFITYA